MVFQRELPQTPTHTLMCTLVISTFSPFGLLSSDCLRMCVGAGGGGRNELEVCTTLEYIHISVHSVHKHTHTCILKPFEDSELTGLKVDIACKLACRA